MKIVEREEIYLGALVACVNRNTFLGLAYLSGYRSQLDVCLSSGSSSGEGPHGSVR